MAALGVFVVHHPELRPADPIFVLLLPFDINVGFIPCIDQLKNNP